MNANDKVNDTDNRMIVIDGVDGSGKGVQSRRLLAAFDAAGMPAILTREPGGCPAAEEIRGLLVTGETRLHKRAGVRFKGNFDIVGKRDALSDRWNQLLIERRTHQAGGAAADNTRLLHLPLYQSQLALQIL